jgi:hypothetical protein
MKKAATYSAATIASELEGGDQDNMLRPVKKIPRAFKGTGILLIIAAGLIHLVAAPDHYEEATYIGVLFSANLIGALASAIGIYRDELWGWWLGAAVAGGAFAMFIVSRLIGLPGFEEHIGLWLGDSVEDYLGIPSLIIEASFVVLFVWVISGQARARTLAQESSPFSPERRERVGTILLISGAVVVFIGHVVHLLFFS